MDDGHDVNLILTMLAIVEWMRAQQQHWFGHDGCTLDREVCPQSGLQPMGALHL